MCLYMYMRATVQRCPYTGNWSLVLDLGLEVGFAVSDAELQGH